MILDKILLYLVFYMGKLFGVILCILLSYSEFNAQQDDAVIDRLDRKDSLTSHKAKAIYDENVVTREVHNLFFRNIYSQSTYNEEEEFQKEIARLSSFDNKKIDTIIYVQLNSLGEYVYDTNVKSNKVEHFLSTKLHKNTHLKIIVNRYMLLHQGDYFSPYRAYENARLIRSSNIFHDVRISPEIVKSDTNHIRLIVYIQDEFPYGFSYSPHSATRFDFGVENQNIAGTTHSLSTNFQVNPTDNNQSFGYRFRYGIPNIIQKSFINAYALYQNFSYDKNIEIGATREFVRPEIHWAGGAIFRFQEQNIIDIWGIHIPNQAYRSEAWISRAFAFRSLNTTLNAMVIGVKYSNTTYTLRPPVSATSGFRFWNSHFVLGSAGYSRIRYVQDRLLNGYGRTEDIPTGVSIRGLLGRDFSDEASRFYYGFQLLTQHYTRSKNYISLNIGLGTYANRHFQSQGNFDFNFQLASKAFRMGSFRLRNFFGFRTTVGINRDTTDFISLNDYNGIRGINNWDFRGNHRYTMSFQSNLFLPISIAGFRFSIFGLVELAKINFDFSTTLNTPLRSGATMGIALKNENLIFDVLQFQYGFYPSTSSLSQRGFSITSIVPFRFQSMDISKPNVIAYE